MFKQTNDNKFNAKWFIRHSKENTFLLVFKTGRKEIERMRCSMLGNLNAQVTGNCDLATSTDCAELFQQFSLMLKTKKLLWSNKHSDCTHNASFVVDKVLFFGKVALFDFYLTPERSISSRKQK